MRKIHTCLKFQETPAEEAATFYYSTIQKQLIIYIY